MRLTPLVGLLLVSGSLLFGQKAETKVKNVSATQTSPASGKEMFNAYCAACHGVDGKGNGPAAAALKTMPADLTTLARNSGGKYPALGVISAIQDGAQGAHGSKEMPVWGPVLKSVSHGSQPIVAQRISNLNGYIESLQAK